MKSILSDVALVAGALVVSFGFWSMYPPAGYVVFGGFLIAVSYLLARE